MAIYPGAVVRLIPKHNEVPIVRYRRMNLHVAVSEARSLHYYFSHARDCSHFYVTKDGAVEQYIDTAYESHADLDGGDSTISVETQGGVRDPEGEPWTPAQVASLARLWAWARDTHSITNKMATNTRSNEASAGLSWHRLGVEGNFANRPGIASVSWKPGGIRYSRARGKLCPGTAKILQVPDIFERANHVTPTAATTPTPTNPAPEAPDMILIRNTDSGTIALLTGDRLVPLAKVADVAALRGAGVPQADVTADTYNRVAQATQKEN